VTTYVHCHWSLAISGDRDLQFAIRLQDGILIRELLTHTKLVVPNVLQNRLFDTVHSGTLAAHLGAERMLQQLRQYYYWPGMRRDIHTWTSQCTESDISRSFEVTLLPSFPSSRAVIWYILTYPLPFSFNNFIILIIRFSPVQFH